MNEFPQEIELKINLSGEDNYHRLIDYLKSPESTILQKNYFLDTASHELSANGWVFRLRLEPDRETITLKGKAQEMTEGITARPEIETGLPSGAINNFLNIGISPKSLPPEINEIIGRYLKDEPLTLFLQFTNIRKVYKWTNANRLITLEVDRTEYPDKSVAYELEVEFNKADNQEEISQSIRTLLESLQIPIKYQNESKFARALKKSGAGR